MNTRFLAFLLLLSALMAACGNGQQTGEGGSNFTDEQAKAQDEAFGKMMAMHDEAMPKLDDMNRAARGLKPYMDSLDDKTVKEEINLALKNMETAEDHMMEWMMASPKMAQLRDSLSHEAILSLLDAEEQKIAQVNKAMTSSLQDAESLLARIQESRKKE